jgi:hypothetical protein
MPVNARAQAQIYFYNERIMPRKAKGSRPITHIMRTRDTFETLFSQHALTYTEAGKVILQ